MSDVRLTRHLILGRIRGDFLADTEGSHMAKPAQQRGYPPDYRRKILELVRAGRSVASLSREFEVARPTIMGWMKQDDADSGRREDILTSDEREELIKLRRENKRLKLEQEILSKAAAWFAREAVTIPEKSSDS